MDRPPSNPIRGPLFAASAALAFVWIAIAVASGDTQAFDLDIRQTIHSHAWAPLTDIMRVVTQLGGGWFLWPLGAVVVFTLARQERRLEAVRFAIVLAGAELVNESVKLIVHRPRPEPFFGYSAPVTYSFPSGHAFLSLCFYVTLAKILIPPVWLQPARVAAWSAIVALVLLIGFSRVYMGVHYPTDVIAGYTAAIAWMATARAAQRSLIY